MTKYKIHKVSDILAAGGIDAYEKLKNLKNNSLLMTTSITLTKEEDELLTKLMRREENRGGK